MFFSFFLSVVFLSSVAANYEEFLALIGCNNREKRFITIEDGVLHYNPDEHSYTAIGNFLTRYYNARGFAKVLSICFKSSPSEGHGFLDYMPSEVCDTNVAQTCDNVDMIEPSRSYPCVANVTVLQDLCSHINWDHPHENHGFWVYMLEEMKTEIKEAVSQYVADTNTAILSYSSNSAVIYSRCVHGDSLFGHGMYGPTSFSIYDNLANSTYDTIHYIIYNNGISCKDIHIATRKRLRQILPGVKVTTHTFQDHYRAFAHLVLAPNVLIPETSTFGLMAGLGNDRLMITPKLWPWKLTFSHPNVLWSDATVVNRDFVMYHLAGDQSIKTTLEYLETH